MASRGLRLWSSLAGLAFVVLAIVGAILLFDGPSDSSPAKMTSYYDSSSNRTHIHIGWVLTGLGLFALIWFVAALRERVRASEQAMPEEGTFLSTVVLVGGTVYIAVTMAAIAVADGMRTMSDDTYQHRVYSGVIHAAGDASYLLVVTAGAAMASLIFATSVAVRRYAILPSWVGWFGFVARRGSDLLARVLHDAGLAALDRRRIGLALPREQTGGRRQARAVRGDALERLLGVGVEAGNASTPLPRSRHYGRPTPAGPRCGVSVSGLGETLVEMSEWREQRVREQLRVVACVECGSLSDSGWRGWGAYRVDDPELDEPPALGFYCPACAEAEFGQDA